MTDTTVPPQPFAITPVWVLRHADLSVTARLLYGVLASYADSAGCCWPSQQTLIQHLRVTERTVRRALDDLVRVGAIEIERVGRNRNNRYKLGGHQRQRDRTPEPSHDRTPEPHELEPVQLEPTEQEVVMRQTDRPTPITDEWEPSDDVKDRLASDCEGLVNLDRSLRRFRNYYIEKGTRSRAWDHKFEAWVLNDLDKVERETPSVASGPDEFGMMPWQHKRMNKPQPDPVHPGVAAALAKVIEIDRARTA